MNVMNCDVKLSAFHFIVSVWVAACLRFPLTVVKVLVFVSDHICMCVRWIPRSI